jgi:hypothetical protein
MEDMLCKNYEELKWIAERNLKREWLQTNVRSDSLRRIVLV